MILPLLVLAGFSLPVPPSQSRAPALPWLWLVEGAWCRRTPGQLCPGEGFQRRDDERRSTQPLSQR